MSTFNNFKSTKVCGNFSNSDYPDGSVLADGVFDRNLSVKNDLWLGKVVINYNENGQPISAIESGGTIRFFYQGIQYNIRPMDLIQLDGEKFSLVAMRSWVIEQLGLTLQNYLLSSTAQSTYQPIILYDTIPTLNSSRMITSGNLFNIFQNYALNSSLNNYALT